MDSLMILIPIALVLTCVAVAAFTWAVRSGQYDDLESPAHRILYDDDEDMIPPECKTAKQSGEDHGH